MEWFAAIARRPPTSSTCAGRCAHDAPRRCPLPALAASWSQSAVAWPAQGDAVAAGPLRLFSLTTLASRLLLPCVDTDRRIAVIRFMVILIALSIAQFLTLAATVSPSDTHI
jgi:hypothetical protein